MLIFRGVAGVLEGMSPEAEGIYLLKFSSQKRSAEELAATPQGFQENLRKTPSICSFP